MNIQGDYYSHPFREFLDMLVGIKKPRYKVTHPLTFFFFLLGLWYWCTGAKDTFIGIFIIVFP